MKVTYKVLSCILAGLMILSCLATTLTVGAETPTATPSASKYDPNDTTTVLSEAVNGVITIDSANELMAFANELNGGNNFAGKTIKLNCDVVFNEGDVSDWTNPIAWSGNGKNWDTRFAGSFDGDGHVISGIYNKNSNNAGLFGRIVAGTEFKNVSIVNSYFESTGWEASGAWNTGAGIGGLIGSLDASSTGNALTTTISNVHVEATIVASGGASGVGGIVGNTANYNNSSLIIENCSFNGTINATGDRGNSSHVGGIIGHFVKGKALVLENCSADATITCGNEAGGLVGEIMMANAMISNCLAKGDITANTVCTNNNKFYRTGAIIGYTDVWSNMTVQISNVLAAVKCNSHEALIATLKGGADYTITFELESIVYDSTVQTPSGWIRRDNGNNAYVSANGSDKKNGSNWYLEAQIGNNYFKTTAKTSAELKGVKVFDFWNAVEGDYPTPPTVSVPDLYNGTASQSYLVDGTTVRIYTAEQLMGFAAASLGSNFSGKTVKLERDIIINKGDASTWETTAPTYNWECSSNWNNRFAGTFDGQGHTISGVYSSLGKHTGLFQTVAAGSVIKNVSVVNSYFAATADGKWVGGIIGYTDGGSGSTGTFTVSNVSVNAIVKGTAASGGIIGSDSNNNKNTTTKIENCAVNGEISSTAAYVGGFVGYVISKLDISGSTFKGSVSSTGTEAAKARDVGGLIGRANVADNDVTVSNCIVNADISCIDTAGGLAGRVLSANKISVSDCLVKSNLTVSTTDSSTGTAGLIGYVESKTAERSAEISNTLISAKGEKAIAVVMNHWGDSMLTVTLDNVKYDSNVYNGANTAVVKSTASELLTADYTEGTDIAGMTTTDLKGVKVFDGWTAVAGDYPVPTVKSIDALKTLAYENYGDATAMLGYQIATDRTNTVRLLATLSNELNKNYVAAGFKDITITSSSAEGINEVNTVDFYYCQYAYNKVLGGGKAYTASEYFSDSIFCLSIENLPSGIITIEATPFVSTSEGEMICGGSVTQEFDMVSNDDLVTAMSFNVRYDLTENQGADRVDAVAAHINAYAPDVVGIQEDTDEWKESLDAKLADYTPVRYSTYVSYTLGDLFNFSDDTQEWLTIYYRSTEYDLVASGAKWLSDTPDTKYSEYSESNCVRAMTYAVLERNDGERFLFVNTHLDHDGENDADTAASVRAKQTAVLLAEANELAADYGNIPVIIVGDFNADASAAIHETVKTGGYNDSRTAAYNADTKGTWNPRYSSGTATSTTVYDYCYVSENDFVIYDYTVADQMYNEMYTSDHFPVVVRLIWVE